MLTQTFQDIIGHEPFHWRGDRQGLEAFNRAFTDLLGDDQELTSGEMQDFEQFLSTIHFPPNPYRNFDNTLSTNVPVPSGTKVFGSDGRTNGDAQRGLSNFLNPFVNCRPCHTFPTGLGSHKLPVPGGAPGGIPMLALEDIPPGPNGEQHLFQLISLRSDELPFKVPQLRNLGDRLGMNLASTNSRAGFGFMHDGRVDTLARLVDIGFLVGDPLNSDIVAFLLSFSGSDLPPGSNQYPQSAGNPLGPASKDVPSAVGRQITFGSSQDPGVIQAMLALANSATSRVDLVVKGFKDGLARGWFFNRSTGLFQSDRNSETITPSALMMLATPGNEFTYTVVPRGSGQRIGIDRDEDGHFDRTELEFGSDPANRFSNSLEVTEIAYSNGGLTIIWTAKAGKTYRVLYKTSLAEPAWSKLSGDVVASNSVASKTDDSPGVNQRYYLVQAVE